MSYIICDQQGADQPAHPRSLTSAFVVRCLDSVMSLVSVTKTSSLMITSVAEQASLSLTWSETPEDTFSHDEAHINSYRTSIKPRLWFILETFSRVTRSLLETYETVQSHRSQEQFLLQSRVNTWNTLRDTTVNPHLPSGLFYPYQLDESMFYLRGVWCTFVIIFLIEIPVSKQ